MSVLSYPASSSPIHRGVFLARSILGNVLKPPKQAIAPLAADQAPDLTTRERVAAQTAAVSDPAEFARTGQWVPVVIGVVTALVVHLTKTAVRPAANVATAGVAAPVLSTIEDFTSVSLVFIAILIPALVAIVLIALAAAAVWLLRRRRRRDLAPRPV
jgi:hypothetical protein